jgi:hypothetical protein
MAKIPDDPGQCRRWVKDRRRKRIADEKKHKSKIESKEIDDITDNIDRVWGAQPHHGFTPLFAGFGAGGGGAGTYIFRSGKLVPK